MFGLQELVVLFVIGLLILGPERLPRFAARIGRWIAQARKTADEIRYELERQLEPAAPKTPGIAQSTDSAASIKKDGGLDGGR